jgi:Tfp pilus assembly protein PilF
MKKTLLISITLGMIVFNSFAQRKPEPILTPEEYYTNAMSYKSKDNYTEAWRLLSKALTAEPDNTTYKMEMADIQYNRRAYFEAIPLYEEMLETDQKNLQYLSRLAEMYSMSPKKMKGVEYAERVIKLKPTDPYIHRTLGRTYYEVQHYPKALAEYQEAEKVLTTDKDLPMKIAYCYMKMNDNKNAMIYYEKALSLDPDNARQNV